MLQRGRLIFKSMGTACRLETRLLQICSGVTTIRELATVYEKLSGTKVNAVQEGSLEDLVEELARLRKEKCKARNVEYMSEAAAVLASKGLWEMRGITVLEQFKEATSLEGWLRNERMKEVAV